MALNTSKCNYLMLLHFKGLSEILLSSSADLPTQLSHILQWTARGGRKIRQVEQYLSLITTPLTRASSTRGGGYSSLTAFVAS